MKIKIFGFPNGNNGFDFMTKDYIEWSDNHFGGEDGMQ